MRLNGFRARVKCPPVKNRVYSGCSLHFEEYRSSRVTKGNLKWIQLDKTRPKFSRFIVGIFFTCLVAYQIIFISHTSDKHFGIRFKKSTATVIEAKSLSLNLRFV